MRESLPLRHQSALRSAQARIMADSPQRRPTRPSDLLEPVRLSKVVQGSWTDYLVLFLRLMAGIALIKGLYHWVQVCGIGAAPGQGFEAHTVAWQTTTVFFAVLDLVAAVGLWLAAAWGAVLWLTSAGSVVAGGGCCRVVAFGDLDGGGLNHLSASLWREHICRLRRDVAAWHLSFSRDCL